MQKVHHDLPVSHKRDEESLQNTISEHHQNNTVTPGVCLSATCLGCISHILRSVNPGRPTGKYVAYFEKFGEVINDYQAADN